LTAAAESEDEGLDFGEFETQFREAVGRLSTAAAQKLKIAEIWMMIMLRLLEEWRRTRLCHLIMYWQIQCKNGGDLEKARNQFERMRNTRIKLLKAGILSVWSRTDMRNAMHEWRINCSFNYPEHPGRRPSLTTLTVLSDHSMSDLPDLDEAFRAHAAMLSQFNDAEDELNDDLMEVDEKMKQLFAISGGEEH